MATFLKTSYQAINAWTTHLAVMMGLHWSHNFGSSARLRQCLKKTFQEMVRCNDYLQISIQQVQDQVNQCLRMLIRMFVIKKLPVHKSSSMQCGSALVLFAEIYRLK